MAFRIKRCMKWVGDEEKLLLGAQSALFHRFSIAPGAGVMQFE